MRSSFLASLTIGIAVLAAAGCRRHEERAWQGYFEGDFVYVASPLAGRLERLAVAKGDRVAAGAPLFALEQTSEVAAQREAADRLRSAQARLDDLKKGSRPSELAALEARVEQARAAAELSQRELERVADLFKRGAAPESDFDRARLTHERNVRATEESAAQLATARLGGRPDAIAAATAEVAAAAAAKERADWSVAQKTQSAPRDALVYDTLFREGEFVATGTPVVVLLPPANLKVRFFVPETEFAALRAGQSIQVRVTGRAAPLAAQVNYLSPRPEYTPPILYNRENRSKLVFMVEAALDPAAAADLHPGQPVDVAPAR